MSDNELFNLAKRFGGNALLWRRKFVGLLPEIHKRRLWEKKNFGSVFEFAKKLAGLSEDQVRRVLNLERRFENFPNLKDALVNGEVSVNKLVRIVSIASCENEEELAHRVKILSKNAVETLVRDEKNKNQNGLFKPKNEVKSVPEHNRNGVSDVDELGLTKEVAARLWNLKSKGLDLNELLTEMLDKREMEIKTEKEKIAKGLGKGNSRYVPVNVRKVLEKEYGGKCSIDGCYKRAEVLHHTQTFALSKKHDPRFLAPLCKAHHELAHMINLKMAEKRITEFTRDAI